MTRKADLLLLGIRQDLPSEAEIRLAFRKVANIYHPDRNGGRLHPKWQSMVNARDRLIKHCRDFEESKNASDSKKDEVLSDLINQSWQVVEESIAKEGSRIAETLVDNLEKSAQSGKWTKTKSFAATVLGGAVKEVKNRYGI